MSATPLQKLALRAYAGLRATGLLKVPAIRWAFERAYTLYKRHYEDQLGPLLARHPALLQDGAVIDVGANIGFTAALFRRHMSPGQTLLAIEPEAENFAALQNMIRSQGLRDVLAIQAAVGSADGTARLRLNPGHSGDHRLTGEAAVEGSGQPVVTVPLRRLDSLAAEHGLDRIALIKIDVQGFELEVCRGMGALVQSNPALAVILEYDPTMILEAGSTPQALLDWIAAEGLQIETIGPRGTLRPGLDLQGKPYVDLLLRHAG